MRNSPTTFLKALLALAVASLPLQAEAKPEKKDKKGKAKSGEVRKGGGGGGQKKQKSSIGQKAQKERKQNVSKPKERSKPKLSKSPASRQKANISKPQSGPKQQKVSKLPARPKNSQGQKGKKRAEFANQERKSPAKRQNSANRSQAAKTANQRKTADRTAKTNVRRPAIRDGENREQEARGVKRDQLAAAREDRNQANRRGDDSPGDRARKVGKRDWDKVDRRPAQRDSAEDRQRKVARSEWREKVKKERRQNVAERKERNRDRQERFRQDRRRRIVAVQKQRQTLRTVSTEVRSEYVHNVRKEVRTYWHDRGDEVRYRVDDRCDDLFHDDWWENRRWRSRHVAVSNPWWWWQPARFGSVNMFLNAGWNEPVMYDYGTDVIYDDSDVYVHGASVGSPMEYSQSVITLANPVVDVIAEAPVVESEWTPLGVWALVQEDQGDAVMFFQLSVDQQGMISGAYVNVVSGEELPVVGQVDRSTQRAAWHIGDQTEKVFEAGMANLTQSEASCLVHLAPGEMQPWLLVRMEGPDLPVQSATIGAVQGIN